MRDRALVLLVNFGGPRTLSEVADFLKRMMGKEMPKAATGAVLDRYRAIGGGSPLAAITDEQAALLGRQTGGRFPIGSAYCYSHPSIEERIDEAYRAGVEHLVFFVMSPYCSSRTTGVYTETIDRCLDRLSYRPSITFIHGWHNEAAFLDCWAGRIREESPGGEAFYLFSAHSLPESLIHEPYKTQVEETVSAVATRLNLGEERYTLAWQSVPARATEPWIGPSVENVLDSVAHRVPRVIEVPIGFVSDHLETRYDMDVLHRDYARALGLEFFRFPSLNTYGPFIEALAVILERSLGGKS
jgi:protoporphyrin/coproporphyrin ferrochelatase